VIFLTWWSILKKPQLSLREKDYTKFRESQALDTLNRILVKDPANNIEAVNRVGFRNKGIEGGKSKRPFVEMMTDKSLKPETLKELRDNGFYITGRVFTDDETGEKSMGYYIRAESFGKTANIEPTNKERELLTTPQSNPEMDRRDRKLKETRETKRKDKEANYQKRLEAGEIWGTEQWRKKQDSKDLQRVRERRKKFANRKTVPKEEASPEQIKNQETLISSLKEQREQLSGAKAKKMRKRIENEERKLSNMR